MSLFIRVDCSFYRHRKTIRLRSLIGDDAFWVPPALWAYAAEHQPDGDFKEFSDKELAISIGYTKDAQAMLQALLQACFLDPDMKIHDWAEHNGYHLSHKQKAQKAAIARWEKERSKERENLEEKRGEESARARRSASSIAPSIAKDCFKLAASQLQASERDQIVTLRSRLNVLFKRNGESRWGCEEEQLLVDLSQRNECLTELKEIEGFFARGTYRPQKLLSLLRDWTGALDRARNWEENSKRNDGDKPKPKMSLADKELLDECRRGRIHAND